MNEDLEQLLKNLQLQSDRRDPRRRARARREGRHPVANASRAAAARPVAGPSGSRARLAHQARASCPRPWTLETFPFKRQPGVNQRQIRTFAELDFIPKAENIVFIGPTGVGKTGLASALLLKALQNGYRGLFIRAQDLFDEMYASLADRSTRKLAALARQVDVLVIDEMGYLNLNPSRPTSSSS